MKLIAATALLIAPLLAIAPMSEIDAAIAAPIGPDAARCGADASGSAFLVSVTGFKARSGSVRVQLYGARPADFLAKGRKLRRIDLPVIADTMDVCMALPAPGTYAIAVRHDANGDGKSGWNDGGGFSRNPRLSLTNLEPAHRKVAIVAGVGVQRVPVVMQYRRGLTIAPWKSRG